MKLFWGWKSHNEEKVEIAKYIHVTNYIKFLNSEIIQLSSCRCYFKVVSLGKFFNGVKYSNNIKITFSSGYLMHSVFSFENKMYDYSTGT